MFRLFNREKQEFSTVSTKDINLLLIESGKNAEERREWFARCNSFSTFEPIDSNWLAMSLTGIVETE